MSSGRKDDGDPRHPWLKHIVLTVCRNDEGIRLGWKNIELELKPSEFAAMRSSLGPRAADIFDKLALWHENTRIRKVQMDRVVEFGALPTAAGSGRTMQKVIITKALLSGTRIVVLLKSPESCVNVYQMEDIRAWLEKALDEKKALEEKKTFCAKYAPKLTLLGHRKVQPGADISHPPGSVGTTVILEDGTGEKFRLRGSSELDGSDDGDRLWEALPKNWEEDRRNRLAKRFEELKERQDKLMKRAEQVNSEIEDVLKALAQQHNDFEVLEKNQNPMTLEKEFHQVLGLKLPPDNQIKKKFLSLKQQIKDIEDVPLYVFIRKMWYGCAHVESLKPRKVFVSVNIDGILKVQDRKQFYEDLFQEACTDIFGPDRWLEDQVSSAIERFVDVDVDSKIFGEIENVVRSKFAISENDGQKRKLEKKMEELKNRVVELAASKEKPPVEVKEGVMGLLWKFTEHKVTLGVVSGNLPQLAWSKLEGTPICKFFQKDISGFGNLPSLKEAVEHARKCAETKNDCKFDIIMHIGHTVAEKAAKDQTTMSYVLKTTEPREALTSDERRKILSMLKLE